jgi:hypothetical protein
MFVEPRDAFVQGSAKIRGSTKIRQPRVVPLLGRTNASAPP